VGKQERADVSATAQTKILQGNRFCRWSADNQADSSREGPTTAPPTKNPREFSALSLAGLEQRGFLVRSDIF
jgi:hypothetical protein